MVRLAQYLAFNSSAVFQASNTTDSLGAGRYLGDQCGDAVLALERFRDDFQGLLSQEAASSINDFLKSRFAQDAKTGHPTTRDMRGIVVALAAVEAQISFIFSTGQEQIKARSERAFMLLQRMLVVDGDFASKWKKAFAKGEVACEQLGAVHLLWQGIFAFKVDAKGARTDLIFNEPPDEPLLTRSVEGLILTEWKKATKANAAQRYRDAFEQAELYKSGPLAALELAQYRYLVAVTQKALPPSLIPSDHSTSNGITYRHINVAVEPEVPSKAARTA